MTRKTGRADSSDGREARLKAALRANLARRKAQGRARDTAQGEPPEADPTPDQPAQHQPAQDHPTRNDQARNDQARNEQPENGGQGPTAPDRTRENED